MHRCVGVALVLVLCACGAHDSRELTQPCDGLCNAGLSCVAVNFTRVCLVEVTDPQRMRSNGDPMCPQGMGGFQTMSGVMGSSTPPEHHALCAPLCQADGDCSFGNKCLMVTLRQEAGGQRRGLCLPE